MDPKWWAGIETYTLVQNSAVKSLDGATKMGAYIGISFLLIALYSLISYSNHLFSNMSTSKLLEASKEYSGKKEKRLKAIIDYGDRIYIGTMFGKVFSLLLGLFIFQRGVLETLYNFIHSILGENILFYLGSVGIVIFAYATLVMIFGEYIPRIMVENRKKVLRPIFVSVFYFFMQVFKPANAIIYGISRGIVTLFKVEKSRLEPDVTEEDLLMMVGQGTKKGVFEASEHDMITNIFEFDDVFVEDIMTHRTELAAIEVTGTAKELIETSRKSGYSRIPVFDEDLDNIIGVIYVKDLLDLVGKSQGENTPLTNYIRPAVHVPEINTAKDVFLEMTDKKVQMAIVVDEYGGTSGIVTMEDLLEFIVGSIEDEYDDEEDHDQIEHIGNNEYVASGQININILSEVLEVELPLNEDYETLSGLLTTKLGFIPDPDERDVFVIIKNIMFTILDNDNRKINKVRIKVLSDEMLEDEKEKNILNNLNKEKNYGPKNIIED